MSGLRDQLDRFLGTSPTLGNDVYIATGAVVIGDVRLGDQSSVWYNAVLRGDINFIEIGRGTNIQDNATLHLADDYPCRLGDFVTVGHGAVVHACEIGSECLIGMGATILDGALLGEQCLVGANALVTGGFRIPPGSLVLGSPAKVVRELSPEERADLKSWADKYVENAAYHLHNKIQCGAPLTVNSSSSETPESIR